MISGSVGSFARFSVMHGTVAGPVAESQRDSLDAVHRAYDMTAHFTHGSPQSKELTDEVIDAFGIAGPASYCIERFAELAEMGLSRFYLTGPGRGADEAERRVAPPRRRARPAGHPRLNGCSGRQPARPVGFVGVDLVGVAERDPDVVEAIEEALLHRGVHRERLDEPDRRAPRRAAARRRR